MDLHLPCSLRKTFRDALHIAETYNNLARACVAVADITEQPQCVLYPWTKGSVLHLRQIITCL